LTDTPAHDFMSEQNTTHLRVFVLSLVNDDLQKHTTQSTTFLTFIVPRFTNTGYLSNTVTLL